jgi:hypothetical protein
VEEEYPNEVYLYVRIIEGRDNTGKDYRRMDISEGGKRMRNK